MNIIKESASKLTQKDYLKYLEILNASFAFNIMNTVFNLNSLNIGSTIGAFGIYELIKKFIIKNEKYSKDYGEIRELYDKYVESIANLFKDLKIDNDPVKMCYLISPIIANGIVSNNFEYECDEKYVSDFYKQGLMGAQVATGKAYTYNVVRLFRDVLTKLNIESDIVTTLKFDTNFTWDVEITKELLEKLGVSKGENLEINNYNINRIYEIANPKLKIEMKYPNSKHLEYGNHDVIGIYKDNEYMLLDPNFITFFYPYKSAEDIETYKNCIKRVKSYCDILKTNYKRDSNCILTDDYYNFYILLNIERTYRDKYGNIDEKYCSYNKEVENKINSISKFNEENVKLKDEISMLYIENLRLFDSFHNSNKKLYNDINTKMLKLKNL